MSVMLMAGMITATLVLLAIVVSCVINLDTIGPNDDRRNWP